MKVIIAGSRNLKNITIPPPHKWKWKISEVVCGGAQGPDTIGRYWANQNNIPVAIFKADWSTHGRAAGPIRNTDMAVYADALIAYWDGESKGTYHMIQEMERLGKKVHIIRMPLQPPS